MATMAKAKGLRVASSESRSRVEAPPERPVRAPLHGLDGLLSHETEFLR